MGKSKSLCGRKFKYIDEPTVYTIKVYNTNGYVRDEFGEVHDIHCVDDTSEASFDSKKCQLLPEETIVENSNYSIF